MTDHVIENHRTLIENMARESLKRELVTAGLDILAVDVQFVYAPIMEQLTPCYVIILTARGLLLGDQYQINNVHCLATVIPSVGIATSYMPDEHEIDSAIETSCDSLRERKRTQGAGRNGGGPGMPFDRTQLHP